MKAMNDPGKSKKIVRVIGKAALLFLVLNILFAVWFPTTALGKFSAYNHIFPGRWRLPYGENPERSYNLSLFNLEAMFASHELAGSAKQAQEFRVILIGDSSMWGFLLPPEETLSAEINHLGASMPDGRLVRAYNLGYPVMSLTKDLLILSRALQYEPDMIVWAFTLESFPRDKQMFPELLKQNQAAVNDLIDQYQLDLEPGAGLNTDDGFLDRTIIGARRSLADLLRLQIYGALWAATGIDQDIPVDYTPRMEDLPDDERFHDIAPPDLSPRDLSLDILRAGIEMAGDVPVLLVNEPMFISSGENSDIRYNFYYPRWAYDDYRQILTEVTEQNGWQYQDHWQAVSNQEFTNSAVHLSPEGSAEFARQLVDSIIGSGE